MGNITLCSNQESDKMLEVPHAHQVNEKLIPRGADGKTRILYAKGFSIKKLSGMTVFRE
ncbi:hypothetical protein [Peribacillus frigoritolerans]|uniref:Uncharacterized protein n=1 Tax=Peribacillus castrilensis TaxID=2897690 RepID=A0AAW9NHB3_9BACI|nr:hypothetical protein [Peribacillus castrilensis]